jgi:hypothetical protein
MDTVIMLVWPLFLFTVGYCLGHRHGSQHQGGLPLIKSREIVHSFKARDS